MPADETKAPSAPVCERCTDTHRMDMGGRAVPCTSCPLPCEACRSPGPYCKRTPCGCDCHGSVAAERAARLAAEGARDAAVAQGNEDAANFIRSLGAAKDIEIARLAAKDAEIARLTGQLGGTATADFAPHGPPAAEVAAIKARVEKLTAALRASRAYMCHAGPTLAQGAEHVAPGRDCDGDDCALCETNDVLAEGA